MSGGAAAGPRSSSRPYRIAIVGGGFTGAAAAVAIADTVTAPAELLLIHPSPDFGKGLAYGRARAGELLNVRSRDASLFPDRPDDFLSWLSARDPVGSPSPDQLGDNFMPRATYGDYVSERAMAALGHAPLASRFIQAQATTVSARTGAAREPLLMAVAIGASIDFVTPFGHHNNTLAMSLGGYRFRDFVIAGGPVTATALVMAIFALGVSWL